MSKDVQKFLNGFSKNEVHHKQHEPVPVTQGKVIMLANVAKLSFIKERLTADTLGLQLSEEDIGAVAGGAFPNAVNGQITDSISQAN